MKMKLFKDIVFTPHRNTYIEDGLQGTLDLGDGLELSVVQGKGLYGSSKDGDYEIAVFNTNEKSYMTIDDERVEMGNAFVPLKQTDDVMGWVTPDEIDVLITEIQEDSEKFLKKVADAKAEWEKSLED